MPLQVGQRLGDYEVEEVTGVGGVGPVYRVRNLGLNRIEAMEVLLADVKAEPFLATGMLSRLQALASFDHPNIAKVYPAVVVENQLLMTWEYFEGKPLEQHNMPVGAIAWYVSEALAGLSYAHGRGVVHGNVKPPNLIVASQGGLKIVGFEVVKPDGESPDAGQGAPNYLSPEQINGGKADARSDIYSVGAVLYGLLTGRPPFVAENIPDGQADGMPKAPIELNPAIPAGLNAITMMVLAKDPALRFQNAEAFRNALKSYCEAPVVPPVAAAVVAPVEAVVAPAAAMVAGGYAPVVMPAVADVTAPVAPPSAPSSVSSYVTSTAPEPSFGAPPQPVAAVAAPLPSAYMPVGNAEAAQAQISPVYTPTKPSRGSKPLWIATGAIAAILALAAVGMAWPHWMKARAAASGDATGAAGTAPAAMAPAATSEPASGGAASGSSTSTPPVSAPIDLSDSQTAPPQSPTTAAVAATAQQPSRPSGPSPQVPQKLTQQKQVEAQKIVAPAGQVAQQQAMQVQQQAAQQQVQAQQIQQREFAEAMGQVQQRMVDMDAQAAAVRRQVDVIRREQEAAGLGMRGDVEAAEAHLDAYLRAAADDVQRGDAVAAKQELNKAEPELKTLEKFLGH